LQPCHCITLSLRGGEADEAIPCQRGSQSARVRFVGFASSQ
jgi:hypothetical protein